MMTRDEIEQRLAEHQAALRMRSPDGLAALHAPDATLESPAHGVVRGRDGIRDVYKYWYAAIPDFMLSWDRAVIDPPRAAVFWVFEGTVAGPFFGEVKPGTHVRMKGAAEFTYGEGTIVSVRFIFDFSALLVSAGVLKIKPAS